MKPVQFEVTFKMCGEVPDDWEDDMVRFHYEENHCVGNHIRKLHEAYISSPRVCVHCGDTVVRVTSIGTESAPREG